MSIASAIQSVIEKPSSEYLLREPIEVGELPTPALVLNLPAFEKNLKKMAEFAEANGKAIRPHAKTHKCPLVAKKQTAEGAVGVCVAKVSEALCMALAGINSILITSPITTNLKAQVLNHVASYESEVLIVLDSEMGLSVLKREIDSDRALGVVVDVDIEMGRTGTRELETILRIIEGIESDDRFIFRGVQHYSGHLMHIASYAERREKSLLMWDKVSAMLHSLDSRNIDCEIVTGGGTGTYDIDVEVERLTDLQVGSYVFMDQEYRLIGGQRSEIFEDFDVSLTVACSTISQPRSGAITVDGGYKSFASETVEPVALDIPGSRFKFAGDEHGVLLLQKGEQEVELGTVHQFITPHCDPTVNLHDNYWVQREDGLIHSCWPITSRGCSW